jgi:putative hydrolase of the HAD superfamily
VTGSWTAETVRILAGRLGARPTPAAVDRAVTLRRELGARLLADVTPATLAALDGLRAREHPLALCSNTTAETADLWPAGPLATRFAAAAFSPQVGAAKPAPRIYLAAAEALGVPPEQCWFVGDGADGELAGAAAVGMAVIRTTEFQDTDPNWPGAPIRALSELADRLG